ncbi:HAMP domain-containing histidine kinase [Marinihelvus fidelis]|uniref:histidine kinase n=1 Tax=Marinihelvus fidelis TaxID=2613842 RepID=A0A5N0T4I3_9GAMM|nr:HAMP domain-containing sensor histidine kinase [Marinihelvus fidelis]KAA9129761.1 HAMP domain-containing histidine kinase [Marinihelvus fidelis]
MQKIADFTGYPLSPALTLRVLRYLNGFRLFVALALGAAFIGGLLTQGINFTNTTLAAAVLLVYFGFAVVFIIVRPQDEQGVRDMALQSLLLDVLLMALLLNTFDGLAVLLVFTGAAAGIVLPLRLALLIAGLASLAVLSGPTIAYMGGATSADDFLTGGVFGVIIFIITTLTHILANWAREFRLIAEQQLLTLTRLEQINELVIRRLRSGVLAVGPDGHIKMMNESAWFLLGSPPAARRALEDISPELKRALDEWMGDPRLEPETLNLNASQAQVVPKFVSVPAGNEISVVVFLEDNDVVSQRALEMSSVSLARLSTSIAHEVRNPLSAISHAAQLLEEDDGLTADQDKLITIIRNNVKRTNGIIENILQMSRREKSQHEIFAIAPWLEELREEFNTAYRDYPFRLELPRGNPEETGKLSVMFDRSQLHQVLWKLMENALQHLGDNRHRPELVLRLGHEHDSGFCKVSVEDNGEGIEEEKMVDIFQPFYTTRKEGSGLGLYIARQLVEANQAELTVDSDPGERTRFHVRMTLAGGGASIIDLNAFREGP